MNVLLFIWQLPQNIIGYILSRGKQKIELSNGTIYYLWKGPGSISLGQYVIVTDERAVPHEAGHCAQSRILGPFYLIVIGLPSLIWCILHTYTRLNSVDYYSFYTEAWAERYRKQEGQIHT